MVACSQYNWEVPIEDWPVILSGLVSSGDVGAGIQPASSVGQRFGARVYLL